MKFLRWLAGFVEVGTPQSSTRAIAFMFAFASLFFIRRLLEFIEHGQIDNARLIAMCSLIGTSLIGTIVPLIVRGKATPNG